MTRRKPDLHSRTRLGLTGAGSLPLPDQMEEILAWKRQAERARLEADRALGLWFLDHETFCGDHARSRKRTKVIASNMGIDSNHYTSLTFLARLTPEEWEAALSYVSDGYHPIPISVYNVTRGVRAYRAEGTPTPEKKKLGEGKGLKGNPPPSRPT